MPRSERVSGFFMGTNLFVGNLPYSVDDADLARLFSEVGTVASARVITDRMSGQSRGFGFVEMTTDAEAAQAIAMLHGREVNGRVLSVSEARPREDRGGYGERRGGYGERRGSSGGHGDRRSGGYGERRSYSGGYDGYDMDMSGRRDRGGRRDMGRRDRHS
jgi:RNA recognition motif-containing protein